MDPTSKKTLFIQGSILAIAGLITKIIGFIYRIPMANLLGAQGNGIYSVSFGIYNIALTLSSYSLPLAVSKMVSMRIARNEHKNSYRVFKTALIFAVAAGIFAFLILFFGAEGLEILYDREGLVRPLRVLAPTAFVVALLGVFRGYFQGKGNMVPTAISQVIEQIVNAIVSIYVTYEFMRIHAASKEVSAYGAAGGTVGTLAGAMSALLLFIGLFLYFRHSTMEENKKDKTEAESIKHINKMLIRTVFPIILSQTIYQIGYTLDDFIFGNIMGKKGFQDAAVSSLQGVFNTQYNQLINLPVSIATAMAASIMPMMVYYCVQKQVEEVKAKITLIIKMNLVIAFPSAVGLAVLSKPIIQLLFPRLADYQTLSSNLLLTGSVAVIFYTLSTITTAILQGNNYMGVPVLHSGISLVIHVVLVSLLLVFTDFGVYALVIGNVTFPLMVCLLNCRTITREIQYKWEYWHTFFIPFLSSVIMGGVSYTSFKLMYSLTHISWISLVVAVLLSMVAYLTLIILLRCFTHEELKEMPMGNKIIKMTGRKE